MKPLTQVLIKIKEALQSELITDSGLRLYFDGSYRREWTSSVVGTVVALPLKMSAKEKKIAGSLKVGDEICFSYRVVADFEFKGDGQRFMPATEDNPYTKEFISGQGERISMYALPKRKGLIGSMWVGMYLDKKRNLISGQQGTEEEVQRWMSQFQFGKTDEYTFNNFFEFEGEQYWKANLEDIFAKKVRGHLVAVGNRVICRPIEEDVPDEVKKSMGYMGDVKIRHQNKAKVLTGGKEKGVKKDEVISFNPQFCEKYNFYGKDYFLVNQNFILGKWQNN